MSFDLKLVNGDLSFKNGEFELVRDSDKLVQDVLKLVSTPLGANRYFPTYGCQISSALIGTAFDKSFVSDLASQLLKRSLENLQRLQQEQVTRGQRVTAQELLAAVVNVKIDRAQNDSRYFLINLTVLSRAFVSIPISFAVSNT